MQLTARPLCADDACAMNEILAENEAHEPAQMHFDLDEVTELLVAPSVNLPSGSVALLDGDRLVGWGLLEISPPSEIWKGTVWGGVRTTAIRQGIGRRIVSTLAEQARALRDADNPAKPGKLSMWLPGPRLGLAALAAQAGLETWRYFTDMRLALPSATAQPAQPPTGVDIVPWTRDLDEFVLRASNESFADHWGTVPMTEDHWRHRYTDSQAFRPAMSRLAVQNGDVIGFVLVCEFVAETRENGYRTGYIDRVGTVEAARGRRIASTLLTHTLQALTDDGYQYADLGVDADSPTGAGRLYERLGFEAVRQNSMAGRDF